MCYTKNIVQVIKDYDILNPQSGTPKGLPLPPPLPPMRPRGWEQESVRLAGRDSSDVRRFRRRCSGAEAKGHSHMMSAQTERGYMHTCAYWLHPCDS